MHRLWVALTSSTGAALFIMGAARLDACNKTQHLTALALAACANPAKAMLVAGAALMVIALPPLLFFNGCAAPPNDPDQVRVLIGSASARVMVCVWAAAAAVF